jgi:hypothetical protein
LVATVFEKVALWDTTHTRTNEHLKKCISFIRGVPKNGLHKAGYCETVREFGTTARGWIWTTNVTAD